MLHLSVLYSSLVSVFLYFFHFCFIRSRWFLPFFNGSFDFFFRFVGNVCLLLGWLSWLFLGLSSFEWLGFVFRRRVWWLFVWRSWGRRHNCLLFASFLNRLCFISYRTFNSMSWVRFCLLLLTGIYFLLSALGLLRLGLAIFWLRWFFIIRAYFVWIGSI